MSQKSIKKGKKKSTFSSAVIATIYCFCCYFYCPASIYSDGKPNERFVLDNPADMSTYLGYENHGIHDMSSLVNEAKAKAHGQSATGSGTNGAASGTPYNVPSKQLPVSDFNTKPQRAKLYINSFYRCL